MPLLLTVRTWRALAYLLTTLPVVGFVAVPLASLAVPAAVCVRRIATGVARPTDALLFVAGALAIAAVAPPVAWVLAAVERRRLRIADDRPLGPRPRPWLWRALGYLALFVTVIPLVYGTLTVVLMTLTVFALSPLLVHSGPMVFGSGRITTVAGAVPFSIAASLVLLFAAPYLLTWVAAVHGSLIRALLAGAADERLRAELVEVARSRARLADAFEAERHRIERDLHDGAQQKLIGLTLQLGLARLDLPPDAAATTAVTTAHEQAKELMVELRELIHGIRPQVLGDLGLPAALPELAERFAVPVTVDADLPDRLPPHVESTAYFVVAEALTNVAKHSAAASASVHAFVDAGRLVVEVVDSGHGGADPGRGTGLTGLADRVAVADGRMLLSSPPGGPTVVRIELPVRAL
ncbi:histidine kinase [Dactylosporangium sp. NPDC051541]|uniref:sensor histidine kinase n=1 Tax=Dactylosporangium sp. NPDC051541 TaxID=3363977 RepID=UPI00379CAEAB